MVQYCVAHGCKTLQDKRVNIQFHSFPFKRPQILQLWLTAINRDNWKPSRTSRLCSKHFNEADYQISLGGYKRLLKLDAVPSIFNFPKHLQKDAETRRIVLVRREMIFFQRQSEVKQEEENTMEIDGEPARKMKDVGTQTIHDLESQKYVLQRKVKTLKQKLRRKDIKIQSMENLIAVLKKNQLHK